MINNQILMRKKKKINNQIFFTRGCQGVGAVLLGTGKGKRRDKGSEKGVIGIVLK
jgi:hypothetical protein